MSNSAQAQVSTDTVDVQNFHSEFLDTLVFNSVIEKRFQNNLAKLFWSDDMMSTAKEHAVGMSTKQEMYYLSMRKGQCIVSLEFDNVSITYQDLADLMIQKWLASPGHKKLLLGEFFIYGATASSFTLVEKNKVYFKGVFYVSYEP
ncbi:MAG: hypothetical protein ABJG68_06525 [Crocinitomicaceae bacterium]